MSGPRGQPWPQRLHVGGRLEDADSLPADVDPHPGLQPERHQHQGGRRRVLRVQGQVRPEALQDHLEAQRHGNDPRQAQEGDHFEPEFGAAKGHPIRRRRLHLHSSQLRRRRGLKRPQSRY